MNRHTVDPKRGFIASPQLLWGLFRSVILKHRPSVRSHGGFGQLSTSKNSFLCCLTISALPCLQVPALSIYVSEGSSLSQNSTPKIWRTICQVETLMKNVSPKNTFRSQSIRQYLANMKLHKVSTFETDSGSLINCGNVRPDLVIAQSIWWPTVENIFLVKPPTLVWSIFCIRPEISKTILGEEF